ncbi:putative FmdB family regulatory protein [Paraburkholderia sp. RAU2J]|nr:putative FmdB family regulatory protein [Paraburkholderia sp. RAU2J]
MPLHDYVCRNCKLRFETLVRAGTTPVCPHCRSTELDKQLSAPSGPARSKAIITAARRQAAREGDFSHYSAAERSELLRQRPERKRRSTSTAAPPSSSYRAKKKRESMT